MSRIHITDLNNQITTLTETETATLSGGGLEGGTMGALGLVGIAIGAATAMPVVAAVAAGAAVISAGIGIYQVLAY